jgi:hypothetical protein
VEDLTQTMEQPPTQPSPAEPTVTVATEEFAEPTPTPPAPEKLTRKQLGQLRRQYVTLTHGRVKACEHLARFSKDHDPKNNCVYCWEAYLMTCVDLDFVHAVLTQKGAKALVAIRGTKFVRMFHGFLSTKMLPMLQAEINKENAAELPATIVGGTFGNSTAGNEVQTDSITQ